MCCVRSAQLVGLRLTAISAHSQLSRNVLMNSECLSLLLFGVLIKNRAIRWCTNCSALSMCFCIGLTHIPWLFGCLSPSCGLSGDGRSVIDMRCTQKTNHNRLGHQTNHRRLASRKGGVWKNESLNELFGSREQKRKK